MPSLCNNYVFMHLRLLIMVWGYSAAYFLALIMLDATVPIGPSRCSVTDGHHFLSN